MSKLLVKILIGLVTVISVLGLFSFTTVKLSNQVRFEHYWSALMSPPLAYLTHQREDIDARDFNGINVVSANDALLTELNRERIALGQVVFDEGHDGLVAWSAYGVNTYISLNADFKGEVVYRLYLDLIKHKLQAASAQQLGSTIDDLSAAFPVRLEAIARDSQRWRDLNSMSSGIVQNDGFLLRSKQGVTGVISLEGVGSYLVVFPKYYSAFSWPIIFFLMVVIVGALTLLSYLLIQSLERRLRNIETAASRISRGELDARVSNAGDEDSISRLGVAFNSMADHIQRLMLVQKEMIHAVSHELRTPVARIRFGVQMIEDCPGKKELEKQVRGIDGDIQELDELIDEILTYARLEQGGPILAFQEADVSAIVEQVVSEQSSVKPEMTIYSEYKEGSETWKISEIEARYIHRSIQNLVGNATRYADSQVKVVCVFDAETCRIDVEDNGPGIPESDWESVFTPFARLDDSRTRSSGGYGLGLSIVRRILYWHGGQAFLGRSDMGGAKFSLVWPRKQAKQ